MQFRYKFPCISVEIDVNEIFTIYTNKGKIKLRVSFDHYGTAQGTAGFLPADTMKAHYCEVLRRLTLEIRLNKKKLEIRKISSRKFDFDCIAKCYEAY